jgi:hypothetical protein
LIFILSLFFPLLIKLTLIHHPLLGFVRFAEVRLCGCGGPGNKGQRALDSVLVRAFSPFYYEFHQ